MHRRAYPRASRRSPPAAQGSPCWFAISSRRSPAATAVPRPRAVPDGPVNRPVSRRPAIAHLSR
ncbi:MAG: hypothetical protein GC150_16745 [Rhizobiales bacterium]|nr:hypothetical protein [Hyphomicrobiales bacterium]